MATFLSELAARAREAIAGGDDADAILRDLCLSLERELPGSAVGVTAVDRRAHVFEHAVFPSLADDYAAALKGILVADKPGSCALAVYHGKTADCVDVAFDGRFSEGWKQLGLKHGLRALLSIPAKDDAGHTLGTLVVTYTPGRPLSDEQQARAYEVAALAGHVLGYRLQVLDDAG